MGVTKVSISKCDLQSSRSFEVIGNVSLNKPHAISYSSSVLSRDLLGRNMPQIQPRTARGNDCELVLTVKVAICNHCGVMTAFSHKTLKIFQKFLRFFQKKRPLTENFCSERFIATPSIDVLSKFHEIWPTGNRALLSILRRTRKAETCKIHILSVGFPSGAAVAFR